MVSEIAVHDKVHGTDLNRQQCPGHGEKSGNGTCQEDGLEESQGREFCKTQLTVISPCQNAFF